MKEKIERIEVITVDERYTTTEAEHYLKNYSKKMVRKEEK